MATGGMLIPKNERFGTIEAALDLLLGNGTIKDFSDRGKAYIAIPQKGISISELVSRFETAFRGIVHEF